MSCGIKKKATLKCKIIIAHVQAWTLSMQCKIDHRIKTNSTKKLIAIAT